MLFFLSSLVSDCLSGAIRVILELCEMTEAGRWVGGVCSGGVCSGGVCGGGFCGGEVCSGWVCGSPGKAILRGIN